MDWLHKSLWYGHANFDTRMFKNAKKVSDCRKFHYETHKKKKKMESGINNSIKNFEEMQIQTSSKETQSHH